MKHRIKVTPEFISVGKRYSAEKCPIAQAVRNAVNMDTTVGTISGTLYPDGFDSESGRHMVFGLPDVAQRFIMEFDSRKKPEPFEFELDIPE